VTARAARAPAPRPVRTPRTGRSPLPPPSVPQESSTTTTLREVLARDLAAGTPTFSFEFFAPKTQSGTRGLWDAVRRIEPLSPTFVSVTYGAGGSSKDRTVEVTRRLATHTTLRPVAR